MTWEIKPGNCLDVLKTMPDETVQCCVTSPPYWGLRDYGIEPSIWGGDPDCVHEWITEQVEREMRRGLGLKDSPANTRGGAIKCAEIGTQRFTRGFCSLCGAWRGCYGLEPTPEMYVEHTVAIFREVRRVLRKDGTLWLNLGDCYATGAGKVGNCPGGGEQGAKWAGQHPGRMKQNGLDTHSGAALGPMTQPNRMPIDGLKPKDLVGIPWMVAFALRSDGWYLRQDIVWSKPNPMPESVRDRCTKSHEYIFLMSKSARYFYDQEATLEPISDATVLRTLEQQDRLDQQAGSSRAHAGKKSNGNMKAVLRGRTGANAFRGQGSNRDSETGPANRDGREMRDIGAGLTRNKRSVWTVTTKPFSEAHFATFPPEIPELCIKAGSREDDTILDPFNGAGTTGLVSTRLGRNYIGIELNEQYIDMAERRIRDDAPLFN